MWTRVERWLPAGDILAGDILAGGDGSTVMIHR